MLARAPIRYHADFSVDAAPQPVNLTAAHPSRNPHILSLAPPHRGDAMAAPGNADLPLGEFPNLASPAITGPGFSPKRNLRALRLVSYCVRAVDPSACPSERISCGRMDEI